MVEEALSSTDVRFNSKHVSIKIDRVELEESQFDSLRRFPNLFVSAVFVAGVKPIDF